MNFYQRANLSMSLAIFLGLEVGVIQWINLEDNEKIGLIPFSLWLLFQFLLRVKITIDDNKHFKDNDFVTLPNIRKFQNFLAFSLASLLFAISAATSFDIRWSAFFFISALVVSGIWSLMELPSFGRGGDSGALKYFCYDVVYIILIALIVCSNFSPCFKVFLVSLLIVALISDFVINDTVEKMD